MGIYLHVIIKNCQTVVESFEKERSTDSSYNVLFMVKLEGIGAFRYK
jgi:hypothetical protein